MNTTKLGIALAITAAVSGPLSAQTSRTAAPPPQSGTVKVSEEKPGLLARAKIASGAAIASAQAKVPTGKLDTAEIEEEDGKLIYSLVFKIAGKTGVEEVAVDAMTGKVLGVEHETPADIAKEKKADSVAAAKAKAKAAAARGRGGS